jgi:hypothetical protein
MQVSTTITTTTLIIIINEIYFTGQITLHVAQNSCNTLYPKNMVCFMYIIVNTVHKSDNRNNNTKFMDRSVLKILCFVHHFGTSFAFRSHSE